MGVSDRRPPPLPAPTETSSDNFGGNTTSDDVATDLATDISRRTDRTSQTIPEDGSPITITTSKKGTVRRDDSSKSNQSQTSLLIEYFEAGKPGDKLHSRPSVRVRVTPSRGKAKEGSDHIQITETGQSRKPSYTRRISLGSKKEEAIPLAAGTSELSYSTGSNLTGPPVEVEVLPSASELSRSDLASTYPYPSLVQGSDISSMPPDSTLEGDLKIVSPHPRSPLIEEPLSSPATLKAPERERSLSREREITHRVMERIAQREASGKQSPSAKRTSSREYVVESTSGKRTSSDRSRTEESLHEAPSSLNPSDISRRSERSARSGTSNASINNPKLLQTVEDAIRRLILPELNAVKEEQRIQRNMSKFEKRPAGSSSSARSEDGLERRMSKSSSAPDVKRVKPRVIVTEDNEELGYSKVRRERRSSRGSDRSEKSRQASSETVVKGDKRAHRKRSDDNYLRDAGVIAGAGVLTAAALRHHNSMSSTDSYDVERKKKKRSKSKSRSRTASISEEPEMLNVQQESIPPLPLMPSEIGTDLTRASIQSAETEMLPSRDSRDLSTPPREFEVRQVSRGSPREVAIEASPTTPTRTPNRTPTRTPTRTPVTLQRGLGPYHSNASGTDLTAPSELRERGYGGDMLAPAAAAAAGALGGVAVISTLQDISGLHESMSANTLDHYTPQRPLSPIQSVSSYRDSTIEPLQHSRVQSIRSEASLRSPRKRDSRPISTQSAESYASSQSEFIHAKNRPTGFSLEPGYEIMTNENEYEPETPTTGYEGEGETPKAAEVEDWFAKGHQDNERYRHEFEDESQRDSGADYNRLSTYTNSTGPYLDKVTAGQGLQRVGSNPEYVMTPVAVESAVASLHEPSTLSVQSSTNSPVKEHAPRSDDSFASREAERQEVHGLGLQENSSKERWNTIHENARALSGHSQSPQSVDGSTRRSPTLSEISQPVKTTASAAPIPGYDMPALGYGFEEEEMETNPSIIRGPMAGFHQGDRSHWPYDPTPPMSGKDLLRPSSEVHDHGHDAELGTALGAGAVAATGLGLAGLQGTGKQIERRERDVPKYEQPTVDDQYEEEEERDFDAGQGMFAAPNVHASSPADQRDEGYMSSAQRDATPEMYDSRELDDPSRSKRQMKHLSGMSHGMESPLYDSATGKGIDRIQSKDVVALMDHLTVRDAQRNARDTEILVTLVRSAAEMRNSFEEMKKFIEAQDRMIMHNTDRDADVVVQKVLGGPRPQPSTPPRAVRRATSSEDGNDTQNRRQNFVKRALKGLSMRSTNDLGNIEAMLMQLLSEVEGLKETQARQGTAPASLNSNEFLAQTQDPGYEPEGQAGTSSNPSQSGFLSNPSSRQLNPMQSMHSGYDGRRSSGHRISTVDERDEDEYNDDSRYVDEDRMTTPTQEVQRAHSLPMSTPQQPTAVTFRDSTEVDQTPKTGRSSKHKSQGSSSVFGNFASKVSRWSKTTASTDPSNRVSTERAQRPYSAASRSGSNLNVNQLDEYPLTKDDRLRSNASLAKEEYQQAAYRDEQRASSPLVPENASFERPQYEAHRNSLNLQHPQPRQGPTHRHQNHLETQAQIYRESMLPEEMEQATWGSNPSLSLGRNANRLSASTGGNLSPVYSDNASVRSASEQTMQQSAPPRPPKIRDDGPLVPSEPAGHHDDRH
ncbi:MAG: hypothetical protein INR71_01280, partial [Terriglobus roseus]|nr:hypothetical protein [Terriglobus roseus]